MIRNLRMGIGQPSLRHTIAKSERSNELLTEYDPQEPSREPQPPLCRHRGRATTLSSAIDPKYPDLMEEDPMEEETAEPEESFNRRLSALVRTF